MRKSDIYKLLLRVVSELTKEDGTISPSELLEIIEDNFKPKRTSLTRLAEYKNTSKPLEITHIRCSISNKSLPATEVFFRKVNSGGIRVGDIMLSTKSILGSDIRRKFKESTKSRSDEIILEMQKGILSVEDVARELKINSDRKPDYSKLDDIA